MEARGPGMGETMRRDFKSGSVYLGDCHEILPSLSDDSVEIVVTSPPYNLNLSGSLKYQSTPTSKDAVNQFKDWYAETGDEEAYQRQQIEIISELLRVSASSVFYNHKIRYAWHSRNKYRTPSRIYHPMDWLSGFPIWCEIIWDRCGIGRPTSRFHTQDERIYQLGKPRKWSNEEGLSNIWKIPPSRNKGHVCSFPEELVRRCLITTTSPGDTVLDPYLGSGTSALVAMREGRRFIGIEKEERFFEFACSRIEEAERGQLCLL